MDIYWITAFVSGLRLCLKLLTVEEIYVKQQSSSTRPTLCKVVFAMLRVASNTLKPSGNDASTSRLMCTNEEISLILH